MLQYWAEKFRPPAHPDYCPLVISIMELIQHVKEHITFYKQDVFQGLGSIAPETVNWDPAVPKGHCITQPTKTDVRSMESGSTEAQGYMTPLLHWSNIHLRRRPCQSSLLPCLLWMMFGILCLALQNLCQRGTPQSFQPNPKWKSQGTCQLVKPLALLRQ